MDKHYKLGSLPKDTRYVFIIKSRGYGIIRFLADMKKRKEVSKGENHD